MIAGVSETSDIVVVGAGIFGAATAYALCRDSVGRVTLIDRGGPASGDSGRSFSMVRRHYSNAVTARLAIAGSQTIMNSADEVGVADAGYVRCGYLLTVPERLVEACRGNVELVRGLGLDLGSGSRRDPRRRAGDLARRHRRCSLRARWRLRRRAEDVPRLVRRCFAARPRWSARLRGHGLIVEGGRIRGVTTDRGTIQADRVVLATGARGIPSAAPRCRAADRSQATPGVDLAPAHRGRAPDRCLLGRGHERRRAARPGPAFLCGGIFRRRAARASRRLRPRISEGYEAAVRRAVAERYPRFGGFELVRGFAGPYDYSPDWNPIIGPCPGIEGLYLALAWCGHGFKLSPAVGEVVAAEVTGRTPPIDVSELRPERFADGRLLRMAYGPGARA